ncbi:MAG: response regulator transcription factor [Saprospiraceae bacterium]|nr:response regulator transcription factor [Saprospiraceae bacterium]
MVTIKTLLVDDEYLALNLLEEFTRQVPDLEIVDKVKSPMKALDILNQTSVDLLFLDIQMPTLSGNNLLKTLKNPPITIFTTAYNDYAIEAFELNVIDYLLKPFSFERFLQAVNKAKEQLHFRQNEAAIVLPSTSRDFFSIKVDGKIVKVYFDDILFIEGLKEYVRIVCRDARLVTLESLKNLEDLLPTENFIRVHKSYIIAKNKVQSLDGNLLEINKYKIPISRSKRDEVVEWIFYK